MADDCDVLVIGGGVVGAACAYYLSRAGAAVTLVDRDRPGYGCSYGNAGLIVPSHAMPLPTPGIVWQAGKWLLQRDSPLYIRPRPSLELIRWLWAFLRHANRRHLQRSTPALVALALHSLEQLAAFAQEHGAEPIGFRHDGLIYACSTAAGLARASEELEIVEPLGVPGEVIDATKVRAMEPCLAGPVIGGVHYPREAHAEPLRTAQAFARQAEANGVDFRPYTEVFQIDHDGGRVRGVQTTRGWLRADQYVLATGSWSPALAGPLGLRVPIQAGKGYALILPPLDPMPRRPVVVFEAKIAVTPRADSVRFAGTMELAGMDDSITASRVEAIVEAARRFFRLPPDVPRIETWRGLRPCTPDGLPMIGRPRGFSNLLLAAGHAMLGLTLSAGTGRMIADMCAGRDPAVDPSLFSPARF